MKYQDTEFTPPAEIEATILRNEPDELATVPIAVSLYAPDFEWAQGVCLRLATHPNTTVRGNAILGFGHLARRFRTLDRVSIEPLITAALLDQSEFVRGQAEAASEDVQLFLDSWNGMQR